MARGHIYLDRGSIREGKTRVGGGQGAAPVSDTLSVYPGESLASVTKRAYGANTQALRDKLTAANGKIEGTINVPR